MYFQFIPLRRVGIFLSLLALLAALASLSGPTTTIRAESESPVECKPALVGTTASASCQPGAIGTTANHQPLPGSKNATKPPAHDLAGVTHRGIDAAGPKGAALMSPAEASPAAVTSPAGWRYITCSAGGGGGWTTTSTSWQMIRSCTLNAPEAGFVYVDATASVGLSIDVTPYEARFALNIDNPVGNTTTDRWVNIYTDSGDGTDKSVADTMIQPVSAGPHTIYFLVTRYGGTGTVQIYRPTLAVLYFPSSATDVQSCSVTGNIDWNTTSSSFDTVRSCTLEVPQNGFVYVSGTSSVGLADTPFEGRFRVGIDAATGSASSDRWINVYTDSGDGTDESVATSLVSTIAAGAHTFYFAAARYGGTGTVRLYDPSLSVLYFPTPNVTVKTCSASGSDLWTNNTSDFTIVRSCTIDAPRAGFAFLDANASGGLNATGAGNEWEGQFSFAIDNTTISMPDFDRWINVYNDAGDGTDHALALSGVANIRAGTHTFYFLGKRYGGTGTLRLYSPSLTVLIPGGVTFLPVSQK